MTQKFTQKFNKQNLSKLRESLNAAVSLVEEELGVEVVVGSIKYTDNEATITVKARTISEGGESYDPMKADFLAWCSLFGFSQDDLGKTFTSNGKTFTISGMKPNNRRYPIIATDSDGKAYKFESEGVLLKIGKKPPTFD